MWNYRVVRTLHPAWENTVEEQYAIHEVYYNDNGSIWGMTEQAMSPTGTNVEELRVDLEYMQKALDLPVLNNEEIEFRTYKDESE